MDELNVRLEEMIQQGTSQMSKKKIDEKSVDPEEVFTSDQPYQKSTPQRMRRRRKRQGLEIQRYSNTRKQYSIMTLPSGLLLISFILVYLYPYTLLGVFGVFMCLFVGFKYFILWLNELSDEIMKIFK